MIERKRGRYIPTCDYCSSSLSPELSKDDAIMAMKYVGWSSPTIGERINNYCGKCSKHLGFERPKDKSRKHSRPGMRRDHSPAKGTEDHNGKNDRSL